MTEATQLPADSCPEIGAVYHYGGDNYAVTRVEPGHFLCLGDDAEWTDAIEFTDHVGEGETATVLYVMALDLFVDSYELGVIEEGASAEQQPAGEPGEPTQLPADGEAATPKGADDGE
jgi:hypothetical protein